MISAVSIQGQDYNCGDKFIFDAKPPYMEVRLLSLFAQSFQSNKLLRICQTCSR